MDTPENQAKIAELREACEKANQTAPASDDGAFCVSRFDGWSCWPRTPAGSSAYQPCPDFIPGFETSLNAFHTCEEDGNWFVREDTNKTWANYTQCVDLDSMQFSQEIVTVYCVGYGVSLVALLVSLALFTYFKSLRCARITVHMNLFASFTANNFFWLIWYSVVIYDPNVPKANKLWCQILHVVLYGFLISNYSWMLCEGVYLHTVLVSAFISERRLLKWMLLLGWGIPVLTAAVYGPVRASLGGSGDLIECWMNESAFNIILQVPVVATVCLNVIFLSNIVRVLLKQLRRGPANGGPASRDARGASLQAFRATMLLVPLLGLNFLLTPFRPPKNHSLYKSYEVVSAVTASLQGLCVAILYCFCNGEVIAQLKRKWGAAMFRPRANSCTVTTVSFVRSSYPTNGEEKV